MRINARSIGFFSALRSGGALAMQAGARSGRATRSGLEERVATRKHSAPTL